MTNSGFDEPITELVPLDEMNAGQLKAARADLDTLWAKIERETWWQRFALEDTSNAPIFEDEEQQRYLASLEQAEAESSTT